MAAIFFLNSGLNPLVFSTYIGTIIVSLLSKIFHVQTDSGAVALSSRRQQIYHLSANRFRKNLAQRLREQPSVLIKSQQRNKISYLLRDCFETPKTDADI